MKKLFSHLTPPKLFGLDVNNYELKAFQIEKKGSQHKIVGWNKKALTKGVIDNFEIKNEESFIEIVRDLIKTTKGGSIKGKDVVVSLPQDKVFLRTIDMPKMTEKEAKEAIKWEMEDNLPISVEEVYYDWQIVGEEGSKMKVLVEAAAKRTIDSFVTTLKKAGLQVYSIEADLVADGRSILSPKSTPPTLLVDIGREGTGYFIYQDGYPVLSSGGSVSGELFTDAIAKYYNVDYQKAESYKRQVGLGSDKESREEAFHVFGPLLSMLVQEIDKAINFYESEIGKNKKKIEKIIICGGASNLNGILTYLAIHLKKPVVQGNPWQNISLGNQIPAISKKEAQSFITVIGLALRGCEMDTQ